MKTSKIILAAAAALALSASPSLAYEAKCELGDQTRLVKVNYAPKPGLLCEVRYAANGGGERQPWWANVDRDFCERKARELVGKFRNEFEFECEEKNGG